MTDSFSSSYAQQGQDLDAFGPTMGKTDAFFRYFPEKIQPAINPYQGESKRLLRVLDGQLKDNAYFAGDHSIAYIANWACVQTHCLSGVAIDDLYHLRRWLDAISRHPAVQKGVTIPPSLMGLSKDDPESAKRFAEEAPKIVETGFLVEKEG